MSARKPVGQKKPRLTGAHEPLHDAPVGAGISAGFLSCHASHASMNLSVRARSHPQIHQRHAAPRWPFARGDAELVPRLKDSPAL